VEPYDTSGPPVLRALRGGPLSFDVPRKLIDTCAGPVEARITVASVSGYYSLPVFLDLSGIAKWEILKIDALEKCLLQTLGLGQPNNGGSNEEVLRIHRTCQ